MLSAIDVVTVNVTPLMHINFKDRDSNKLCTIFISDAYANSKGAKTHSRQKSLLFCFQYRKFSKCYLKYFLCLEFVCCPCVCLGLYKKLLHFPPTIQKHSCILIKFLSKLNLVHIYSVHSVNASSYVIYKQLHNEAVFARPVCACQQKLFYKLLSYFSNRFLSFKAADFIQYTSSIKL